MEIEDLITDYDHALDARDWPALDGCFAVDAVVDYSSVGAPAGRWPEMLEYLKVTMPRFAATQHLTATSRIRVSGDRATARSILFNPMVLGPDAQRPGNDRAFFVGLWYDDEFVRTDLGWRFASRVEQRGWVVGHGS